MVILNTPDSLGVAPDDFYDIDVSSTGHVSVNNSMWSEKRSMDDILEIVDGKYILKGRSRYNSFR